MYHESRLEIKVTGELSEWCSTCPTMIPPNTLYFEWWDDHNGMEHTTCRLCVKKCYEILRGVYVRQFGDEDHNDRCNSDVDAC